MRYVVGCPVYERAWILPAWFFGCESQSVGVDRFIFVYTPSEDDTLAILKHHDADIIVYDDGVHGKDRDWTNPDRIKTLATMRNLLLNRAAELDVPTFISLDSDIIPVHQSLFRDLDNALMYSDAVSPTVLMGRDKNITNSFIRRADGHYRRTKPGYQGAVDVLCGAIAMRPEIVQDPEVRYGYHPLGEDFSWSQAARANNYQLAATTMTAAHAMEKDKDWIEPRL